MSFFQQFWATNAARIAMLARIDRWVGWALVVLLIVIAALRAWWR